MDAFAIKWLEELEEVVHCPVCLEKPEGRIVQCGQGHHICEPCKKQVINRKCPTCQCDFNGGRSYVSESILIKIEDIRKNILDKGHYTIARTSSTQYSEKDFITRKFHVPAGRGTYPCLIGSCTLILPHCRMIEHIRKAHKSRLNICSSERGTIFKHSWHLNYFPASDFHTAFHITDMELFFVVISLDCDGNFVGNVQIVNTNEIGKQFTYALKLKGRQRTYKYKSMVYSCQAAQETLYENSLHISSSDVKRILDVDGMFECVLSITRNEELPNMKTRKIKSESRNNYKNGAL